MNSASEFLECRNVFESLRSCGLAKPLEVADGESIYFVPQRFGPSIRFSEKEVINRYYQEHWTEMKKREGKSPSGYHVLAFGYHLVSGDFHYPESGPDANQIEVVVEDLVRITAGRLTPKDVKCSLGVGALCGKYVIKIEWSEKWDEISVPADPQVVPVDEVVMELNKVLSGVDIEERFIGVTPPPPAEESGYIFATVEAVREAKRRGLLWCGI